MSMDVHVKSVDMDMDVKFHIHDNRGKLASSDEYRYNRRTLVCMAENALRVHWWAYCLMASSSGCI